MIQGVIVHCIPGSNRVLNSLLAAGEAGYRIGSELATVLLMQLRYGLVQVARALVEPVEPLAWVRERPLHQIVLLERGVRLILRVDYLEAALVQGLLLLLLVLITSSADC